MNSAESYFEDLLMRVVEGVATEEEFATFSEIIRVDAELRRRYATEMRLHALLSCQGVEKDLDKKGLMYACPKSEWLETDAGDTGTEAGNSRRLCCWWKVAAAVAFVLLGGTAAWWRTDAFKRGGTADSVVSAVRLVSQKNVKGLDLPEALPGELRLESGVAVVGLRTGVELTLIGPVRVVVQNGLYVAMERGKLLANVPQWATGFTVRTRDLEICDLGTLFSVALGESASDVFVFKGGVQVNEAGYSAFGRACAGADVGICKAGEGVRSVAGERPQRIAADWPVAQKMFASVEAGRSLRNPAKALETATEIADLWAERNMPESNFVAKRGNGIKFQKTAWVRLAMPQQQEENSMNKASAAAVLTAAAVMMGAETSEAFSEPVLVQTSPCINRHWSTVFTNEVPLKWNWSTAATRAELEIKGMNGSCTINFTGITSNYLWRAFGSSAPSTEDVYDLTLTFYNNNEAVVGVLTSQLSVVTGAFGETAVDPGPSTRRWTTVRNNAVIPYDATWAAATAGAASSRLVIAKVGGATQTNAWANASGYYGWKLKNSGWGYGAFNLALTFPGMVGEWDATLTRPVDGTLIKML